MSRTTLVALIAAVVFASAPSAWAKTPPCSQTSGVPCTIGGTLLVTSIDASHGGGGGGATVTFIDDPVNPGVTITSNSPITAGPGETSNGFLAFTIRTVSGLATVTDRLPCRREDRGHDREGEHEAQRRDRQGVRRERQDVRHAGRRWKRARALGHRVEHRPLSELRGRHVHERDRQLQRHLDLH